MKLEQKNLPFDSRRRPDPKGEYGPCRRKPSLDTRTESIIAHQLEGKVCEQAKRVWETLRIHGPMSRNGLERYFQKHPPGIRLSAVCGRVRELQREGFVAVVGDEIDSDTGKRCETLEAVEGA